MFKTFMDMFTDLPRADRRKHFLKINFNFGTNFGNGHMVA